MDTRILEKLYIDDENVDFGRRIINKGDINSVGVVIANKGHIMRSDKLAVTMGVTDINQISILNEIMNPFMIEEGHTYLVPDSGVSKYYDAVVPEYPTTSSSTSSSSNSSSTNSANDTSSSGLSAAEITAILEPETDKDRQNRLNSK